MKLLIALFFTISPALLVAQSQEAYEPIDKIGWELPVISDIDLNPEKDSGSVTYLLTVNKHGVIKKTKILANTFSETAESRVRDHVKNIKLIRKEGAKGKVGYKGTLQISVDLCMNASE